MSPRRVAFLAVTMLLLAGASVALVTRDHNGETGVLAAVEQPAPAPAVPAREEATTTTEAQRQVEPVPGNSEVPSPTSSLPPADRPPTTRAPANASSDPDTPVSSGPIAPPPPPAAAPPPTTPAGGSNCPSSEVRVTVTTDKTAYAPGETVRGSTTIENRSASACLLPTRGFVRILNAAGKDVAAFAYTMEYRFPVLAEPGKTFTTPFTWDQRDCSGATCAQVPAGTYTVTADWTEGGQYSGRGSLTIGG